MPTKDQDQQTQEMNELLVKIENARAKHDSQANRLQRIRWRLGASLVLIGPIAILLAAIHSGFPHDEPMGLLLVGGELAFLLIALIVPFWPVGKSHEEWILERVRTELLRREYFLFRTGIGPYIEQKDLPGKVENRLSAIGDAEDPVALAPMRTVGSSTTWRDELEDTKEHLPALMTGLAGLVDSYLKRRVEEQKAWFAGRKTKHKNRNYLFEGFAKLVLVGAVMVSAVHLVRVWEHPGYEVSGLLFLCIFVLPAIGAALIGMQSLLENERLSHSYAYHAELLEDFAAQLRTLRAEVDHPDANQETLRLRFARIVLDVESMFSAELLRWHIVMQPRAPKAEV